MCDVLLKIIPYAIIQTQLINKLQAVEAVWGQKRPHHVIVRLRINFQMAG